MIKSIIVGLATWKPRDPAADYAISVAKTFDAHLCGAAIAYPPAIAVSALEGLPPEFIEAQAADGKKATDAAIARFGNAASAAGPLVRNADIRDQRCRCRLARSERWRAISISLSSARRSRTPGHGRADRRGRVV